MQDEKLKDRLAGGSGLTQLPSLDNAVLLGQRKQLHYLRENMRVAYENVKKQQEQKREVDTGTRRRGNR